MRDVVLGAVIATLVMVAHMYASLDNNYNAVVEDCYESDVSQTTEREVRWKQET